MAVIVPVAPFAGAWIEIANGFGRSNILFVAPFAGAWIEMPRQSRRASWTVWSLPSRERGLKSRIVGVAAIS